MNGRKWTPTEIAYLKARYPFTATEAICVSLDRNASSVYNAVEIHGLRKDESYLKQLLQEEADRLRKSGTAHRFTKGQSPKNKGRKMEEWMAPEKIERTKATRFTKGQAPVNHRELGSTRISKDGYQEIKIAEPNKWESLHRVMWEETFGAIPKGYNVVFVTKDKMNVHPFNLELISNAELMRRNTYHRYPKEIANAIQLRGALNRQINKRIKTLKNG